jgi:hypothetical protein
MPITGPEPGYVNTTKNCKTETCVAGAAQTVPDDTNVPMSTNPCVTNSCSMGMVVMNDVNQGTSCGNGQTCDGAGNCSGCQNNSDCMNPGACKTVACDTNTHTCKISDVNAGMTCTAGGGKVCDGAGNCVQCNTNGDCAGGNCQFHMCTAAMNGQPCQMPSECASGHCVDNVCCNHSCSGTCVGCTMALTGNNDGVCGPVQSGTAAPAGQCAQAACGNTGNCDGMGGCEQAMAGSVCAMATCVGNVWHPQQTCTNMTCGGGMTQDCMTYQCAASGCPTTCTTDAQCATGNYCATGMCVPKLAAGSPCTSSNQCLNGTCKGNGTCN